MVDIVEAVQKGMSGKYLFHDPSFSEPIFYRAITSYEHEMAKIDAMDGCSLPVMEYMADQASLTGGSISAKELTAEEIIEYKTYLFEMMVNIVYHGTKDFQSAKYSSEIIKDSYIDVLGLAKEILQASVRKKEEVVALVNTEDGVNLLAIHYYLNVPLTSEAWKLTPLQLEFLVNGKMKMDADKRRAAAPATAPTITQEELSKDPEKVKEYLKSLFSNV